MMHANDWLRRGLARRRDVLKHLAAGVALVGCGDLDTETQGGTTTGSTTGSGGAGGGGGAGPASSTTQVASSSSVTTASSSSTGMGGGGGGGTCSIGSPTPGCFITDDNILGPYYKAGAPMDDDIADDLEGDLLLIQGRVFGCDCETPLAGALVDIWQANADGAYDGAGFVLRGKVLTDGDGFYRMLTVVPGWYLNGAQFRPAHVHYKVSHENGLALTTQLYFEGDPYLDVDPFVKPSLVKPLSDAMVKPGVMGKSTTFDIVLGSP